MTHGSATSSAYSVVIELALFTGMEHTYQLEMYVEKNR